MDPDPLPLIKKRQARSVRTHLGRRDEHDAAAAAAADPSLSGDESGTATPSPLLAKTKRKKGKLATRLSFGGDEEESTPFAVKKSTLSRTVSLRPPPSLAAADPDPGQPAPPASRPTYSAADLSRLKANTPSLSGRPVRRNPGADDDGGMGIVLDDEAYEQLIGGAEEMEIDDATDALLSPDLIPTQSHIASARQKRTAARHPLAVSTVAAEEEDFISLDVDHAPPPSAGTGAGPHPDSRLVREEDELGEGDDEAAEYTGAQERIAISKKARAKEAQKRKANIVEVIDEAEADSEDSESREWMDAQVRRATTLRATPPPDKVTESYRAPPIPTVVPIPTLAAPTARLSGLLEDLSTRHAQNTKTLEGVQKEREDVIKNETRVRHEVEAVGEHWVETKALKEWVEGLAEFLDVKFPTLERLEEEHVYLLSERFGIINQRRQDDDSDDIALFLGLPPARPKGSMDESEIAPVVDDSAHSAVRRERRLARINRRLSRPRRLASRQVDIEEEGFSTDSDLSPDENTDLNTALSSLSDRVSSLLSDVQSEEFKDPRKGVGRRFAGWRNKSQEEYVNAWGGLAAVGAWEFWARLEMAGWDPLDDDRTLDSFDWYDALYDYSRPLQGGDDPMEEAPLGPDGDLVSSLISSAIIPRLSALIESGAFDAYSGRHIRRIVDIMEQVEASIGRDSDKFRVLAKSVSKVFSREIAATLALVHPLLASPPRATFDPAAIPARRRFLARRLKLLSNLVAWRKYAGGGDADIEKLLGQIMVPIGLAGWDAGGDHALRKAAAAVPPQLVPPTLKARIA